MKTYKDICILEEKLSSFIKEYILPLRIGKGFELFSDECILYALLEYSKYNRNFNPDERLLYLYSKCGEYSGHRADVKVEYDDNGNFFLITQDISVF